MRGRDRLSEEDRDIDHALTLLVSGDDYFDVLNAVIDQLRRDPTASVRIKSGTVVPSHNFRSSVTYSEYSEKTGRMLVSESLSVALGHEQMDLERAALGITVLFQSSPQSAYDLLWSADECITIAGISESLAERIAVSDGVAGRISHALLYRTTNMEARSFFWNGLILVAMVHRQCVFESYCDSVESFVPNSDPMEFFPEQYQRRFAPSVLFTDYFGDFHFEAGRTTTDVPKGLPNAPILSRRVSPAWHVAASLEWNSGIRISGRDDPEAPAHVTLPGPGLRYPDPYEVIRKVATYCLDREQEQQKWTGFADHEFHSLHPGDSELIAFRLCGALLDQFTPFETRANADGSAQFSVRIALPARFGYTPIFTSWLIAPGRPPSLATAWVDGASRKHPLASPPLPRGGDNDAFSITDRVCEEAKTYAETLRAEGWRADALLWIRHDDDRSRTFARALRRKLPGDTFVARRKSHGGRATGWVVSSDEVGRSEGLARFMQYQLFEHGVRTGVELMPWG